MRSHIRRVYTFAKRIHMKHWRDWWVSERACGLSYMPFIRFASLATPIRWHSCCFGFLVCRRPIKTTLVFVQYNFVRLDMCWLFTVCIELALALSLQRTYARMARPVHASINPQFQCTCDWIELNCWMFRAIRLFMAVLSNTQYFVMREGNFNWIFIKINCNVRMLFQIGNELSISSHICITKSVNRCCWTIRPTREAICCSNQSQFVF